MPTPEMRFATKENLKTIVAAMRGEYDTLLNGAVKYDNATIKKNGSEQLYVPIDTALSATSTNPVQNAIVSRPILSMMGRLGILTDEVPDDWASLTAAIASGDGESVLPIASQIRSDWTVTNGNTVYDVPWNVMHHTSVEVQGGDTRNVTYLQMDRCLPFNTEFSTYQAFLYAIDGLPAGTYNITMGFSWGSNVVSGKTYQFTLTKAVPAGGQLTGFYGAPDQNPSNWRVYSYSDRNSTSAIETCVVTEGSGGTSLGTFTAAGEVSVPASGTPDTNASVTIGGTTYRYYGINSLHRVAYGDNRWLHSAIRQYLNSSGTGWWTPQTVFDRPPSYASHRGFLSGLDPDFVAVMQHAKVVTALNYVTDGGTSASPEYDVTYDRVFLPSTKEHFLALSTTYGGTQGMEGEVWDYWKRVAGTASPLSTGAYHPEYIQYDLASPTTARHCWLRSAYRAYGYHVGYVHANGRCHGTHAINGNRVAPDCVYRNAFCLHEVMVA